MRERTNGLLRCGYLWTRVPAHGGVTLVPPVDGGGWVAVPGLRRPQPRARESFAKTSSFAKRGSRPQGCCTVMGVNSNCSGAMQRAPVRLVAWCLDGR